MSYHIHMECNRHNKGRFLMESAFVFLYEREEWEAEVLK